jgi:hypothetical protein
VLKSLAFDLLAFALALGLGAAVALFGLSSLDYARRCGFSARTLGLLKLIFFVFPFAIALQLLFDPGPALGFFVGLGLVIYRNAANR